MDSGMTAEGFSKVALKRRMSEFSVALVTFK